MSSKIDGVSRALLEEVVLQLDDFITGSIVEELRALLAAPVVERQPVAYTVSNKGDIYWCSDTLIPMGTNLYTAPPELAELQATIAQLTAEVECWRDRSNTWKNRVSELDNEIERLKGGQGEPVYQVCDGVNGWRDVERLKFTACQLEPEEYECRVLFTSQPAPVSVPDGWKLVPIEPTELMIRRGDQNYSWSVAKIYAAMIADAPACLDKVKELNQ